ncbi:SF1B family DNA helicase RecD2, partial [Streptomyces sp. NPDC054796]
MDEALTPPETDGVEGVVDHILHVSFDQKTVLRMTTTASEPEERITAVGHALFGIRPGESVQLHGRWFEHRRYGRQFKAERCVRTQPSSRRAVRLYLASGLVRGIGPRLAEAIVAAFGEKTLQVLDTEPDQLLQVYGIGETRLAKIVAAWQEHKTIADIMLFLQGLDITPALAVKIYATYKDTDKDLMEVITRTPYRLCRDVRGIGFSTADKIALAHGVPKHSAQRLQAAMVHVLEESGSRGHCHFPVRALLKGTREVLVDDDPATMDFLDNAVLRGTLEDLRGQKEVVTEILPLPAHDGTGDHADIEVAATARAHQAEAGLARSVRAQLQAAPKLAERASWEERITALASAETAGLTKEQRLAILRAVTQSVSILTGGPGCGKTHTLRTLVDLLDDVGAVCALAAPTGKAAKRMEEATGHPAMTVHRLLREEAGDSLFDYDSLLPAADVVVIDEASMLDVSLARRLVAALRKGCHLLLVGDVNQLPSIGPGKVLRDLLAVEEIPRTHLTQVFRQGGEGSAIVDNAHRILRGDFPQRARGVFGIRHIEEAAVLADQVVDLVTEWMPRHFGVSPEDIQILCPGRRGDAGVIDFNLRLQERLNPDVGAKPQTYYEGATFRVGDRVLQTRNNPRRSENGVFNGATGTIAAVETETHQLTVAFHDGDTAVYSFTDLDELLHSFALTVHRSQGSEYPYVVIPMTTSAGMPLLQRNLLYTAVTRARKGVMLIGQTEAMNRAVDNARSR